MDGPQQGLRELQLFNNHKITVPGSMLAIEDLFQRGLDGAGRKTGARKFQISTNLT